MGARIEISVEEYELTRSRLDEALKNIVILQQKVDNTDELKEELLYLISEYSESTLLERLFMWRSLNKTVNKRLEELNLIKK
jgi:hypothetical protein